MNTPLFYVRETFKIMLLAQAELLRDTINKNLLYEIIMRAEAFSEQAVILDPESAWASTAFENARLCRFWITSFIDGRDPERISCSISKRLCNLVDEIKDPRVKF